MRFAALLHKVMDTGVESRWQYPLIRRSHRYAGGVHCNQKTKHVDIEAPMSAIMAIQMAHLCEFFMTMRRRKIPSDHLAMAMPKTAKV